TRDVPDTPAFPEMQAAFLKWGRFAYVITNRNRGTAIPIDELQRDHDEALVAKMIAIGKVCGILQISAEGQTPLLRFVHHRFQEFFTATYIRDASPAVSWLDKFDAPRW